MLHVAFWAKARVLNVSVKAPHDSGCGHCAFKLSIGSLPQFDPCLYMREPTGTSEEWQMVTVGQICKLMANAQMLGTEGLLRGSVGGGEHRQSVWLGRGTWAFQGEEELMMFQFYDTSFNRPSLLPLPNVEEASRAWSGFI